MLGRIMIIIIPTFLTAAVLAMKVFVKDHFGGMKWESNGGMVPMSMPKLLPLSAMGGKCNCSLAAPHCTTLHAAYIQIFLVEYKTLI